jgi:hypothetical protein
VLVKVVVLEAVLPWHLGMVLVTLGLAMFLLKLAIHSSQVVA